jgi:predicted AAA+ superfamily ATPase
MFYRKALSHLENWAKDNDRKPLILRGARQVGKTTLIQMFSKQFDNYAYLNLENITDRKIFNEKLSIHEIIRAISVHKNVSLANENTLLFIDEIQNSTYALTMMRYFYEEYRNLYLISAGSLLEAMIGYEQISFPVGRVDYLFLYPVTFSEFLLAKGNEEALKAFNEVPVPDYAHTTLLAFFHEYVMLGGMPEIIKNWNENQDIIAVNQIYRNLMTSYRDDVTKYARNNTMIDVIRHTINSVPLEAGKRITFQGFGNSNYRSREIGEALRALERAMLIDLIYPSTAIELPIIPNKKKKPKLHFLDTGLINFSVGLLDNYIGIEDLSSIYKGRIIEHIVGQELKVALSNKSQKLSFWVREKKQSQAEIDFIISAKRQIIPIETKSGSEGKLRSLHQFMDISDGKLAIRFYSGMIKKQAIKLDSGKKYDLINLPYYLAGKINEILEYLL